jgi:hypothetical protein
MREVAESVNGAFTCSKELFKAELCVLNGFRALPEAQLVLTFILITYLALLPDAFGINHCFLLWTNKNENDLEHLPNHRMLFWGNQAEKPW